MIHVECPHCSKKLSAPEKYAGRQVNCKGCNGIFMLPDMNAIAEQQARTDAGVPAPSPPAGQPAPQAFSPPTSGSSAVTPASAAPAVPPQGQPQAAPPPVRPALATPTPGKPPAPAMAVPPGQAQPGMATPAYAPGPALAGVPGGSLDDISFAEAQHQRSKLGVDSMSLIEARNWTALFDIRFRKFLAPKILRLLWIIFLIGILLWFCFATFIMIVGVFASISAATEGPAAPLEGLEPAVLLTNVGAITPEPAQLGPFPENDPFGGDPFGGGFESPAPSVSAAGGLLGFTITMVTYCLTVMGMFIVLCWARVVFESLHVFYNVAGTLKAIEQKL